MKIHILLVFIALYFIGIRSDSTCLTGVNLSGAEWGKIPGEYNKDYTFPTNAEIDYYVSKGMNLIRFPFAWERLQTAQFANLDPQYLGHIQSVVSYATSKGMKVVLDPHNYARYYGQIIGEAVPATAFADMWTKLSTQFKSNANVIFGLMNEPNTMKTETWLADANTAIAAIRQTGATNLITVPGNAWTGAASWCENWYGTANCQVMLGVKDPQNNFVFEVHQYMDSDGSGTHDACVSATIGSQRLASFTTWARQHGYKAYLGEWAGGRNQVCYDAITDILNHIGNNTDVYHAWTWWAGGPWWGNYMYNLDPVSGNDAPQLKSLEPFINTRRRC